MAIKRKKESFTRWDPADYMKSEDDMAAYIEACLEEEAPDNLALLSAALDDIARAHGIADLAECTDFKVEGR